MRVIIEGAEGTGKSTLAAALAEKHGLDVCHCGRDDPGDYEFYLHTSRKENCVWDRHTIGELIYPKVFNRPGRLNAEDCHLVIWKYQVSGGKAVVLTAPTDTIMERLATRGEKRNHLTREMVEEIDRDFRWFANTMRVPVIDTSKHSVDEIVKMIENMEPVTWSVTEPKAAKSASDKEEN